VRVAVDLNEVLAGGRGVRRLSGELRHRLGE
jgi:hypothetical protein